MTSLFLEKDADMIYEELEENTTELLVEDEYREDRMDQMISRYGYYGGYYDSRYRGSYYFWA